MGLSQEMLRPCAPSGVRGPLLYVASIIFMLACFTTDVSATNTINGLEKSYHAGEATEDVNRVVPEQQHALKDKMELVSALPQDEWTVSYIKVERPPPGQKNLSSKIAELRHLKQKADKVIDREISLTSIAPSAAVSKQHPEIHHEAQLDRFNTDDEDEIGTDLSLGDSHKEENAPVKKAFHALVAHVPGPDGSVKPITVELQKPDVVDIEPTHKHAHNAANAASQAVMAATKAVGTLENLKAESDKDMAKAVAAANAPQETPAEAESKIMAEAKASAAKTVAKLNKEDAEEHSAKKDAPVKKSVKKLVKKAPKVLETESEILKRIKAAIKVAPTAPQVLMTAAESKVAAKNAAVKIYAPRIHKTAKAMKKPVKKSVKKDEGIVKEIEDEVSESAEAVEKGIIHVKNEVTLDALNMLDFKSMRV